MSVCKYCGQKAGWFSDAHEECVQKFQQSIESLKAATADAIVEGKSYDDVAASLNGLIADANIPQQDASAAFKQGWSNGAITKSQKEPLCVDEYNAMHQFFKAAGITPEDMVKFPGYVQSSFSFMLWGVLHGQILEYDGPVRFNLQPGEQRVFGFGSMILYEEKATSSYVGGYSGMSVRVARGMYYHFGGMKGQRVQTSSLQEVDYGQALITSHNFYFSGDKANFRIPYNQVIRFEPYTDGIGIATNHGKKQLFVVYGLEDCGWFLYNVMQALANPEVQTKP